MAKTVIQKMAERLKAATREPGIPSATEIIRADKYDPYRKVARETIDPEARAAITGLIQMAIEAEDESDRLRDRIVLLRDQLAEIL